VLQPDAPLASTKAVGAVEKLGRTTQVFTISKWTFEARKKK